MNSIDTETVADIVAEIRAYGAQPPPRCMWLDIADRVETAARRERDHAVEHATRHAEAISRAHRAGKKTTNQTTRNNNEQ